MTDAVLYQLVNDLKNPRQQISVICMGIKAAGKSTKVGALVRFCLQNNFFDEYFCFLPSHGLDVENSYGWMEAYRDQITIFTDYNPVFAEWLLDRTPEEVAKKSALL